MKLLGGCLPGGRRSPTAAPAAVRRKGAYTSTPDNFKRPNLKARRLGERLASTSRCRPIRDAHLHFSSPILGYPSALGADAPPGKSASANISQVPQIES